MIIDTSALLAIVYNEPEAQAFAHAISLSVGELRISAATLFESSIVVDSNKDPVLSRALDDLIKRSHIIVIPFSDDQAVIARAAYRDFGKGSGHPAQLNFGDCFTYALAKATGEPLMCKGNDFAKTDILIVEI